MLVCLYEYTSYKKTDAHRQTTIYEDAQEQTDALK